MYGSTKEKRFRLTRLRFTTDASNAQLPTVYNNDGEDYLVAAFDVVLNPDGTLCSYHILPKATAPKGTVWYAVCEKEPPSGWYNGQAYVDIMNKEAIACFLETTMPKYLQSIGSDFGGSVPAVFTDEPKAIYLDALQERIAKHNKNTNTFFIIILSIYLPFQKSCPERAAFFMGG